MYSVAGASSLQMRHSSVGVACVGSSEEGGGGGESGRYGESGGDGDGRGGNTVSAPDKLCDSDASDSSDDVSGSDRRSVSAAWSRLIVTIGLVIESDSGSVKICFINDSNREATSQTMYDI